MLATPTYDCLKPVQVLGIPNCLRANSSVPNARQYLIPVRFAHSNAPSPPRTALGGNVAPFGHSVVIRGYVELTRTGNPRHDPMGAFELFPDPWTGIRVD